MADEPGAPRPAGRGREPRRGRAAPGTAGSREAQNRTLRPGLGADGAARAHTRERDRRAATDGTGEAAETDADAGPHPSGRDASGAAGDSEAGDAGTGDSVRGAAGEAHGDGRTEAPGRDVHPTDPSPHPTLTGDPDTTPSLQTVQTPTQRREGTRSTGIDTVLLLSN